MFDDVALALPLIGAAAFIIAWLFLRVARHNAPVADLTSAHAPLWPAALAIATAPAALFLAALGRPFWPPVEASHRIGWLFIVIAVIAAASSFSPKLRHGRWLLTLAPLAVIYPQVFGAWPILKSAAILLTALAAIIAFSTPLVALDRRSRAPSSAFILAGMALAIGGAIAGAGNLTYGKLAWSLALPAIAFTIITALRRGTAIGAPAHTAAAAALIGLLTAAWCYTGDLLTRTQISLPLLPVCPALALLADMFVCPRLGPRAATALRIAAAAVPAAILVAFAIDRTGARP